MLNRILNFVLGKPSNHMDEYWAYKRRHHERTLPTYRRLEESRRKPPME
jgi:hypothetical protein